MAIKVGDSLPVDLKMREMGEGEMHTTGYRLDQAQPIVR
jgi:hypothetical protein